MENDFFQKIRELIPQSELIPEASWSGYSSLGAGTASFPVIHVSGKQDLAVLRTLARDAGFSLFPIGAGTNLAGSDVPLKNVLFVKPEKDGEFGQIFYSAEKKIYSAGCAVSISSLLTRALEDSNGGAAALIGIPGLLGGLLKMNAGANGKSISDFVISVEVMDFATGEIRKHAKADFPWQYRNSGIPDGFMILSADFRFESVDPALERGAFERERIRRTKAPKGRSAGSVFRNPSPELPAGRLLEQCGAKGIHAGAYRVSEEHANWITADPGSKEPRRAEDFLQVVQRMQECVFRQTSIILQPEVRFVNMEKQKSTPIFQKLNILVLKGGVSSEREVSLLSAANVANALRTAGHNVKEYDIQKLEITDDMRKADVVFPMLHGGFGEDGRIQKLMEDAGIAFVGGSSKACQCVMDKAASKVVMNREGIRNAEYRVLSSEDSAIPEGMSLPLIVKPNSEGSTFGLTLVETPDQWKQALKTAFSFDKTVLVEEYINGIEATVGILNGKALPMTEIRYPGKLYDYDAKYTHAQGETVYLCPPQGVSEAAQKEAADFAERFARAVGSTDLLRVDVLIRRSDDKVFVLEGNSLPGFTASSLLPKAAAAAGMSNAQICSELALTAWARKNSK